MFGLYFIGNLNLRRILTDYGFLFNPLKKDFPVTGYSTLMYADAFGGLINLPIVEEQCEFNYSFSLWWLV